MPARNLRFCSLLLLFAVAFPCQIAVAQYNLSSDSTDTAFIAVATENSVRYARYRKQVVATQSIEDLPSGNYFRLDDLDSQPDPEHDPEPELVLARLMSRGVQIEEAWYSPRGREPSSGGMVSPGFPSPLLLLRLETDDVEQIDINLYPVENPVAWLTQVSRSEYALYSFVAGGEENE